MMKTPQFNSQFFHELESFLSPNQILIDQESLLIYGKDWTKNLKTLASAVLFPKTTLETQKIILQARKYKISLVPSGGRTGLSGAAAACQGEVVVSFEKMNRILNFDPFDQSVTCEPGVITQQIQHFALEKNLYFPVDFASRGSSQIGGNISTNAGGIKVLRYGLMRNWVTGLEVVTGAGEILKLNRGLVKNATGYDLRQLFIGAEGTLGLITQATLQLTRPPRELAVLLLAIPELESVMKIYHAFKNRTALMAYEMFTDKALQIVQKHTGLPLPFSQHSPYYVLVEIEKDNSQSEETALAIFEHGLEQGWIGDGALAQSPQQALDFWRFREDISEATALYSPYKNDISVRISKVPEFLGEMNGLLQKEYPHFQVVWFGHVGDGNLHINILKPQDLSSVDFTAECLRVNEILFSMIERFEGSISAEHGVGLTKKSFLQHTRSQAEINLMKAIKAQFDPDHIMNPGKIWD